MPHIISICVFCHFLGVMITILCSHSRNFNIFYLYPRFLSTASFTLMLMQHCTLVYRKGSRCSDYGPGSLQSTRWSVTSLQIAEVLAISPSRVYWPLLEMKAWRTLYCLFSVSWWFSASNPLQGIYIWFRVVLDDNRMLFVICTWCHITMLARRAKFFGIKFFHSIVPDCIRHTLWSDLSDQ
jgi:hypothetical protein